MSLTPYGQLQKDTLMSLPRLFNKQDSYQVDTRQNTFADIGVEIEKDTVYHLAVKKSKYQRLLSTYWYTVVDMHS